MYQNNLPIQEFKISPDKINLMEPITFSGNITIVNNKDIASHAVETLYKEKIIGFDTESRPSFIKGQKFPVSIIQLATEQDAFIFQLKYTKFAEPIISLLSNPDILKVGVGITDDIKRLNELNKFTPQGFIDLSLIARQKGLLQSGAKALTARYLGKKLIKSAQKTNWAKKNLTDRQLIYAATDAWVCLKILNPLQQDNTDYHALAEKYETEI